MIKPVKPLHFGSFILTLLLITAAMPPVTAMDTVADENATLMAPDVAQPAGQDSTVADTSTEETREDRTVNESSAGPDPSDPAVEPEITAIPDSTEKVTPVPVITEVITTVIEDKTVVPTATGTPVVNNGTSLVSPITSQPTANRTPVQYRYAGTGQVSDSAVAMFRGNARHTGVYSTGGITPGNNLLWQVPVVNPTGDPVVSNGGVYVGNLSGSVYAFSDTGVPKWRNDLINSCTPGNEAPVTGTDSTPLVFNSMVYYHWLGWGNGERISILRTTDGISVDGSCGGDRAGQSSSTRASSSPVLVNQNLNLTRFGTGDGWIWDGAPNVISADGIFQIESGIRSSPALDNDRLFFGADNGVVYAIDAHTYNGNNPVWTHQTGGPVYSSPAIGKNVVYIGSTDGYLYALNEETGSEIWKYRVSGSLSSSPAVDNGIVYITASDAQLLAIHAFDGTLSWAMNIQSSHSPTIANGVLYIGSTYGEIFALNEKTGLPFWVYKAENSISSDIIVNNGKIFFTTASGNLVALGEKSPTPGANIAVFGNTGRITHWPAGTAYGWLGGTSGIRRDRSLDSFTPAPALPGNDWVQVTNGAAIQADGTLVRWTPGSTVISATSRPSDTGKKYVAVSQRSDWLLAIYEDSANLTHLEALANPGSSPLVFAKVPTDTGWMRISAGNDFALALHMDGSLVAWGDNTYNQLNLPKTTAYRDIDAGSGFAVGLSSNGTIYVAGKDRYRLVSGRPDGDGFMSIAAGSDSAGALTGNGRIVFWGKIPVGPEPPLDAGYTDLVLGPDYGFALSENAKEAAVTAPLSPGTSFRATDGSTVDIPFGSSFDHTHNEVTRVFAPDGTQILWAYDRNATIARFPTGAMIPLSVVHYVPSGSTVNATVPYHADVTSGGAGIGSGESVMTVSEDAWYEENGGSLPRAMCIAGEGCRVGTSAKQQLFMSTPLPGSSSGNTATDFIPVFSVRQVANGTWVGTLSTLGSTGTADSVSMIVQKANANPNQPINFSIVSGNWGNDTGLNMWVTAQANLTPVDSDLDYTITATASQVIPAMNITPQIWEKNETAGDVLVYTGDTVTCSAGTTCVATGNFAPSDVATYFANATVLYTVPVITANGVAAGTQDYAVMAASGDVSGSVSCNGPPSGAYFDFTINTVKLDCKSNWQTAVCYDNALIRWAKAGKSSSLKSNLTNDLWKENSACTISYSFAVDSPANKPVYVVAVNNNDMTVNFHHAIDAELLDTSLKPEDTTWENWKFFQYTNLDIKIGDWQLPKGGPSFKTKVEVKGFTGIICGYWTGETVKKTFYINQSGGVSTNSNVPLYVGYIVNQTGKTLVNSHDIPIELQSIIKSVGRSDSFTLNKWELDPIDHEITFYVFDILDEREIDEFEGKNLDKYSVHIIHDTEFEEVRNNVSQQLVKYMDDPEYQIAHIGMSTNRISDPPENNAELWVYKSTPENMKLDNLVINGWTINVYPVSG